MKTSRIARFAHICMIVGLIVGLSACDELVSILSTGASDPPPVDSVSNEITLGLVLPLTGPGAAPYGFSMQRGFELAQAEINNSQLANINFITEDDMSTVDGAVNAFHNLVEQGVPAIVGLAYTYQVDEVFPLAEETQVVAFSSLSAGAGRSALSSYAFRTGLATDLLHPAGVRASQASLGYTKVAVIYDEADIYSTSGYENLSAALADVGVEVLTTQTYQTGDTDFSEQIAAMMASDAEAILISALSAEMVQIMSQGREAGIPFSVRYIVPDMAANEVEQLGDAAEGAMTFISWIETSDAPGNQAFVESYRAKYGMTPDPWAAQSYATLHILAAAMANAGSTDSTAIRDALAQTMDFDTILGSFSFDPNGEALYDPIIAVVKDGQIVMFEDSDMPSDDDMPDDGMPDNDTSGNDANDSN